jgi:hypothetical protein
LDQSVNVGSHHCFGVRVAGSFGGDGRHDLGAKAVLGGEGRGGGERRTVWGNGLGEGGLGGGREVL